MGPRPSPSVRGPPTGQGCVLVSWSRCPHRAWHRACGRERRCRNDAAGPRVCGSVWSEGGRIRRPGHTAQVLRALTLVEEGGREDSNSRRLLGISPAVRFATEPRPVSSVGEAGEPWADRELCCRGAWWAWRRPGRVAWLRGGVCRTGPCQAVADTKLREGGGGWPQGRASSDFL